MRERRIRMKIFGKALIVFVLSLSIATVAAAAPASEKTIKEVLAITQVQKLSENMIAQINAQMNVNIQQSLNGKTPTEKQQKAINKMRDSMIALLKKNLSWVKLEPMYIRLYKETFTEEEATGMLKFYKTPSGKAVINKMPVLMQKSAQESQKIIAAALPEFKKIRENFEAEMKAADK